MSCRTLTWATPGGPQASLRSIASVATLGVELVDKGEVSDFASRRYLAWVGALRRTLETLGIERPQQAPQRLADVLKVRAA